MRRQLLALASILVVPAALYACSDDDKTTSSPAEAGAPTPEAGAQDTSMPDTAMPTNGVIAGGCTQADFDKTAGAGGGDFTSFPGVDISFPANGAPAQYTNRCAKVKVGSTVTFAGSFTSHPLEPKDGDKPTPIPSQSTDTDAGAISFKVTAKGTFGYQCNFHPSIMFGAIQVVP
jgi:plastocyanin